MLFVAVAGGMLLPAGAAWAEEAVIPGQTGDSGATAPLTEVSPLTQVNTPGAGGGATAPAPAGADEGADVASETATRAAEAASGAEVGAAAEVGTAPAGSLPVTGGDVLTLVAIGAGALAVGSVLVRRNRARVTA